MDSSTIGSLLVALGLDTAQFEAGAKKSRGIARGLSRDIESSFKSAKIAVEGLVAAFAIGALTGQIKQALQYAAAIGETASTLGVTTKQLQEFRFAAGQVGVSQEALEGGLQRLTVSIGKSKLGSEAQTKAFDALAKAAHTTVAELRSGNTGDVFAKIADALKNVTDRSQRAAAEVALFGKTGAQLDSLLSGGSARLNALAEAAHQLGVVLSDDQIKNAEVTAHKLEALKTVLEANIASTVTQNANSILSLAQALSTLTNQILHFFSSNPQLALGIIGGLAGSRFGVAGAVVGAAGGAVLGQNVAQNAADQNMDLRFRMQETRKAKAEFLARQAASNDSGSLISFRHGSGSGTVATAEKELRRQTALLQQATAAALSPKASAAGINIAPFLAPKGPKGRKAPADRSDELLAQMDKEILQATQNILQAKLSLAGTSDEHLQIAVQLVEIERTVRLAAIDEELAKARREKAEGKITAAALEEAEHKGAILKGEADIEAQVKLQAIIERELTQHDHDLVALADQQLKFRIEALQTADQLATTQGDHRRIQLAILDAEIEQERLQLESNKRDAIRNGAKQEEIDLIQAEIDHLKNKREESAKVIGKATQSPLQAYFDSIPEGAKEIGEALENYAVKGIQDFNDQLVDAILHAKSLKDVFHSVAESILADLLKLAIQEAELAIFKSIFGGTTTPGFAGGGSILVGGGSPPGFATGGAITVGGRSGTDKNLLSLNGLPIARVSYGERINIANDDTPMGGGGTVELTMHNDFRGADPAAVASITARLNEMQAEFPGKVVEAWADANSRFLFRAKRR